VPNLKLEVDIQFQAIYVSETLKTRVKLMLNFTRPHAKNCYFSAILFSQFFFCFFFCNTSWQHLPLNRSSKQILKQDCMISQTDSFVRWAPTGVNSSVRKTCSIFIKTTSSLLGSVPTKRAWVTASARLSIPEGVLLDAGSTSECDENLT
jgi:hypothetical protein